MPSAETRYITEAEQAELNRIGRLYGCCRCGNTDPRTDSRNFVGDFHPPRSIAVPDKILPVCLACSRLLGVELKRFQLTQRVQVPSIPEGSTAVRLTVSQEYQYLYLTGDLENADIPFDLDRSGLAANDHSVTLPCRYWNEGATSVDLCVRDAPPVPSSLPDYTGTLSSPRRVFVLEGTETLPLGIIAVPNDKTLVRVWLDNPNEPSRIVVRLN